MEEESVGLSGADIGVMAAYFVIVILIGVFAMWRANRGTVSGYFLAGRSMTFLPIGCSLFVSNIGTEHFMGLSGSGAASGISSGAWEFNALLLLQLQGWVFLPVYIACGTYTMPEYLSKRFGGQRLRIYFACLTLVLYTFIKCSVDLYTGALFIQQSLHWDLYVSIVILILLTAFLTITGGLTAVLYTDTLQATLMLAGAMYLMIKAFQEVGGFEGLLDRYPQAVPTNVSAIVVNTTCHWPDPQSFRMLRDVDDDYMPWLGFLLGQTPSSLWYWCTDQVIVQRALAAKSLAHAQGGAVMAGFIKIMPIFILVLPGMISRVLYPNEVACTNPDYCMAVCQSRAGCSNIAYPRLVLGIMPDGARGLMMAVMIAALMSDLDSIFNSASTLFTIDVWTKIRKTASNTELMIVGRVFMLVMVGVSIAWVPVIKEMSGGQVLIYMVKIGNSLAPPFAAVFLLGILVRRVNEQGVFWSLMLGLAMGVTRLTLMFMYQSEDYCGSEPKEIPSVLGIHYMYYALTTFLLTGTLALLISFFTKPPDPELLRCTTYWTRHDHPEVTELDVEMTSPGAETDRSDVKALNDVKDDAGQTIGQAWDPKKPTFADGDDFVEKNGTQKQSGLMDTAVVAQNTGIAARIKRALTFVCCGLATDKETEEEKRRAAMKQHLSAIRSLQQSFLTRVVLTIGMVSILSIAVAMYIFWSVYKFNTAPFYPEGAVTVLPGDD